MSYTNAQVKWEVSEASDAYNDVTYGQAVTIKARKQPKQELVKTSNGREVLSRSIFYLDPKIEPRAAQVKRLDKLDGELIESVYVMCDAGNRPKLYRFITI